MLSAESFVSYKKCHVGVCCCCWWLWLETFIIKLCRLYQTIPHNHGAITEKMQCHLHFVNRFVNRIEYLLSLLKFDPQSLFKKNLFPWAFKNLNCNSEWYGLLRSQKSKFWYVLCRIIRPEKLYYNFLLHFDSIKTWHKIWWRKYLQYFSKLTFPSWKVGHRVRMAGRSFKLSI